MIYIGIDPSINRTGVGALKDGKFLFVESLCSAGKSIPEKIYRLRWEWTSIYAKHRLSDQQIVFAIEQPEHQDSAKGDKWIERNDFVKTCAAFGLFVTIATIATHVDHIHCLTPSQWKGQIPKEITKRRLARTFPDLNLDEMNHDEIDGLALARTIYEKTKSLFTGEPA